MTPEQTVIQTKVLDYINAKHTKQLLGILKSCRACGGYYDLMGDNSGFVVTTAQVKAVLATRDHVPNKQEAKAIRKANKKAGK